MARETQIEDEKIHIGGSYGKKKKQRSIESDYQRTFNGLKKA